MSDEQIRELSDDEKNNKRKGILNFFYPGSVQREGDILADFNWFIIFEN